MNFLGMEEAYFTGRRKMHVKLFLEKHDEDIFIGIQLWRKLEWYGKSLDSVHR